MNISVNSYIPPPPQTGREAKPVPQTTSKNVWQQLLATVNVVANVIDPFASDAHLDIRALGRLARCRNPRHPDDYFALGDMCARLTLQANQLSQAYADKALIAYSRAGQFSVVDEAVARRASLAFVFWLASVARTIDSYEALEIGVAICKRTIYLEIVAADSSPGEQLRDLAGQLFTLMSQRIDPTKKLPERIEPTPRQLCQRACDEGQIALRYQRTTEALSSFARALELDSHYSAAWLWQALALTDVARFDEALASYDQAVALDTTNYGAWNSRGGLLMDLGRANEALVCFEHALVAPSLIPVVEAAFLLNKGKALYILERYADAYTVLERSHQLDSTPESAAGLAACVEMLSHTKNLA